MINFFFEDDTSHFDPYFEVSRQRLVQAIRTGMRQGMTNLAQYIVADKLSGSVLHRRTGRLADAVLSSVRVSANDDVVRGTVAAKPKAQPNEGLWQEFGTHHPALTGRLRVYVTPDGTMGFTENTREFSVEPRPFMNPSLHEQEDQIMSTIAESVRKAEL